MKIYPWMNNQWQQVLQQFQQDRLPHALLLAGPEGLGKFDFAKQLIDALLCEKNFQGANLSHPCGQCNGCHLNHAGTHPDTAVIQPESEGKQIQIAAIREINQFVSLKSQFAPVQSVLIAPAEAMNRNAANALLKTLEEPRPGKLIILVSSQPSRLLPTIKSRCQQLSFTIPSTTEALAWLAENDNSGTDQEMYQRLLVLAGGAPLLALQYAKQGKLELYQQLLQSFENIGKNKADPVLEAKRWEAAGLAHSVKWLYLWVSSLVHLKSNVAAVDTNNVESGMVKNRSAWREPALDFLVQRISSANLHGFLDRLMETSRIANTTVNVQLTLESLLIDWSQRLK